MDKINIMIVDDHKIFRDGLKLLFSHFSFIDKVYEASNGREFLDHVGELNPDIVLMDIMARERLSRDDLDDFKQKVQTNFSRKLVIRANIIYIL